MALEDLTAEQRELADFMSELSRRAYCAVWMLGIEYELWKAIQTPLAPTTALLMSDADVGRLSALSVRCGGWITFNSKRQETFVPFSQWHALVASRV